MKANGNGRRPQGDSGAPRVGYYVHHHGGGHASRAEAIARHADSEVTFLGSVERELSGGETVRLPPDVAPGAAPPVAAEGPTQLHHAPLHSERLRGRMALISSWIERARPSLFVVDVSVEVAMLARLHGVPVVYMRQHGRRGDQPHRLAYEWASHLLAPYEAAFEDESAPAEIRRRTFYAGGVSRFDGSDRPRPADDSRKPERVVVVGDLPGRGEAPLAEDVAVAVPGVEVAWVTETSDRARGLDNLTLVSPAALDLAQFAAADVVVGDAGHNLAMECAFARRGLVCIPQRRPFDEQDARAQALTRANAAVVRTEAPDIPRWPELLQTGLARARRLAQLCDGEGSAHAAGAIDAWAREETAPSSSSTPASGPHRTIPAATSPSSHPAAGQAPQRS